MRTFCVVVLYLLQVAGACAEERNGLMHRVSCTIVRYYVAKYSAITAEAWARSKGATDADIEAARRCLPAGTTQTVQAAVDLSAH